MSFYENTLVTKQDLGKTELEKIFVKKKKNTVRHGITTIVMEIFFNLQIKNQLSLIKKIIIK